MKTRILLALVLLLTATFALGQTAPACNGIDAITGALVYFAPGSTTGSPACTDYFGKANYANSPLPVGPVDTSLTGFTIMDGGKNYSPAPTVTITDFYGMTTTQITCTATVSVGRMIGIGVCSASTPDFMAPVVNITDATGSGAIVLAKLASAASGGIHKFVDPMPDLKAALAVPDTTTFPGSVGNPAADFYVIGLVQYSTKLHTDLLPTTLRGYCQLAAPDYTTCVANQPSYLGPVILAKKDRPVRVLFKNMLPFGTAGNLFIPVDKTYMGADLNPDGQPYLQSRATLHLHGGATPWISDGTPHQWTVPAGDWQTPVKAPTDPAADNLNRGVSTRSVPDMWFNANGLIQSCAEQTSCAVAGATNDPGNGNMTFYWTNQQGGRLMFYHDHAYGLTRLNVYVGEAAGYLLADPVEEDLLQAATVPGTVGAAVGGTTPADLTHVIPLVIQDKSFVPGAAQLAAQDPTWNMIAGGGTTPGAANPGDLWFPHVYMPNQNPNDTTGGSNAFGRWDYGAWFFPPQTSLTAANPPSAVTVPCVSAAFPGLLLAPTSVHPAGGCPITPNPSGVPEGFMDTPLVNGKAYPVLHVNPEAYRFHILSAGNDRTLNLSLFLACGSGGSAAALNCSAPGATGTEVPMVPAVRGGLGTAGYVWPDQLDGRDGGVPDSSAMGPAFVQIGTEGGLLPNVSVVPPTPVGYEYARRSITVLNISSHGLLLGPAERADAIVDFSGLGGKTLILYNDAPAPVPAFDSRIDYYTGDADAVETGGAPTTLAGYGPNTRTIMQIVVDPVPQTCGAAPAPPCFSLAALQAALPAAFKATQPVPIVPQPTYPAASGGNSAVASYAGIQDNSLTFTPNAPLNLTEPCNPPSAGCVNFDQKAIQELFTLDYGRMNATMGTEIPLTTFQNQTTIPYGYVDWPTEIFQDGQTQLWKLTHNGVDTHFIHFHLFNVQVINRIGWDGVVKPPDDNELGWKDTVRMNPLEDIVFALTPISQKLPFPLPDSIRSMDVTMPDTVADLNISGLDPNSGNATISNVNRPVNFGWEYVWHCHILGHEENDMMRPMSFMVPPPAPSNFSAVRDAFGNVNLTWTDNSASESGFNVQSSADPNFALGSVINTVLTNGRASLPASAFGGPITATDNAAPGGVLYYRVQAEDDFLPQSPLTGLFQTQAMFSPWVVTQAGSMTTTTINAPAITYGQDGLVTVSVTSPAGPVTGNVTLLVDNVTTFTQALNAGGSTIFTLTLPAVGTHTLLATFAAQGTFAASSASGTLLVNQATPVITWAAPAPILYGTALSGLQLNATASVPGSFVYTPPAGALLPIGSQTLSVLFTPTDTVNYAAVTATVTLVVNQATPVITWATPAAIPFGTALSGLQLNATASVPGSFVYTPPAGTVLNVGSQTLSATFTPTDSVNYATVTATVTLVVGKTTPVITWATPAPITFGTALSGLQLNATASVPGSFVYTPAAGAVLPVGIQTLSVLFTPTDAVNYTTATATVTLTVTSAGPVLTLAPTALTFSSALNVTSAAQTVLVSNTGSAPLRITGITLGGANPTRFGMTQNCPIGGTGLAVGGFCTVSVTFTPNNTLNRAALIRVSVAAPAVTGTVTLTGTTIRPVATLSTASLAFGNVNVNTVSLPQTITVTNTGTVPLVLNSITVGGLNPGRFPQTNDCTIGGAGLAPNAFCTITVTFQPNRVALRSATIFVRSNAANGTQTVALTGTGN